MNNDDILTVENFLNSKKTIVGSKLSWNKSQDRNFYYINIPLADYKNNGNIRIFNDFDFKSTRKDNVKNRNISEPESTIILLYNNFYISRIHFNPYDTHRNPIEKLELINQRTEEIEKELDKNITRFYPWKYRKIELLNNFKNRENTAVLKNDLDTFKKSMNFFKEYCNIEGEIPEYPGFTTLLI